MVATGRQYQLMATTGGYVFEHEHEVRWALGLKGGTQAILVEFDQSGRVLGQTPMEYKSGRTLLPAPSGYYLLDFDYPGIDVTRRVAN